MGFFFPDLDTETREIMVDEILTDKVQGRLFSSPRLSPVGLQHYPDLLQEAAEKHDEVWLTDQLRIKDRMNLTEQRQTDTGPITVNVPVTASETLAEGEFNRFYMRAICLRASGGLVEIYRAKTVSDPRPESEARIGATLNADAVLLDLRTYSGDAAQYGTIFGLPPGPNSGLSVKLIK